VQKITKVTGSSEDQVYVWLSLAVQGGHHHGVRFFRFTAVVRHLKLASFEEDARAKISHF
jgi:hypothetical protein